VLDKFTSFVIENQLFEKTDRVLLAVSGGMDSMVMAELFSQAGFSFAMAHCNFKLRGEDSEIDEKLVKEMAEKYDVPFYSKAFNTKEIADASGDSVQMTARDLRYTFFEEIATTKNYNYFATAHHLDDQTETFFINLLRGCGIAGLHGIRLKQEKIIRPMMFAFRKDIEAYAVEMNVAFREDSSNKSLHYLRNKIRHKIIPLFVEMNPSFREEMQHNIGRLAETEQVFRAFLKMKEKDFISIEDDVIKLSIEGLEKLESRQIFLYEYISPFGFSSDDVKNIISSMQGIPGKMFYSATHELLIDRKFILITALQDKLIHETEYLITAEIRILNKPIKLKIKTESADDFIIPRDKNTAALDHKKLNFPLVLRKWKTGDHFFPLGMKNRKKLSDFFIDEKYSRLDKDNAWVLCSGDDIIWILGERIDDRYKVTDTTKEVCFIEIV
jgi:tRNA(Ile)-lysidine synthase